ncbi:hypothetical protein LZC95_44540 [Pendulispora brunnea]|uniref:Uncharacterized protein n=1 Tax=Pendulispora brunnea TaxID=2905690 RepID=A0ABZ2K479_9BACT
MTTRQKNAIVLVLAVLGTVAALYFMEKDRNASAPTGARVLAAIPADTFLLATVDVAPLRHSPLVEPLRALGSKGMGKDLQSQCGFDPIERLDTLAVALPEAEGAGDFGIASAGPITEEELLTCARTVMEARGAHLGTHKAGAFVLAEDTGILGGVYGKLAVRDSGPFLLAREPWLTAMMDAWTRKKPRVETNTRHMDLRKSLETAGSAGGAGKPAVLVTALLPVKLRDRLKREMGGEVPNATMLGVLGVEAAGVAVTLSPSNVLDFAAELRCETPQACAEVRDLITKKRDEWVADVRVRLIGLGGVLQGLTVEANGTRVSARTRIAADDARRLIERALDLSRAGSNVANAATGTKAAPAQKDAGAH